MVIILIFAIKTLFYFLLGGFICFSFLFLLAISDNKSMPQAMGIIALLILSVGITLFSVIVGKNPIAVTLYFFICEKINSNILWVIFLNLSLNCLILSICNTLYNNLISLPLLTVCHGVAIVILIFSIISTFNGETIIRDISDSINPGIVTQLESYITTEKEE